MGTKIVMVKMIICVNLQILLTIFLKQRTQQYTWYLLEQQQIRLHQPVYRNRGILFSVPQFPTYIKMSAMHQNSILEERNSLQLVKVIRLILMNFLLQCCPKRQEVYTGHNVVLFQLRKLQKRDVATDQKKSIKFLKSNLSLVRNCTWMGQDLQMPFWRSIALLQK